MLISKELEKFREFISKMNSRELRKVADQLREEDDFGRIATEMDFILMQYGMKTVHLRHVLFSSTKKHRVREVVEKRNDAIGALKHGEKISLTSAGIEFR